MRRLHGSSSPPVPFTNDWEVRVPAEGAVVASVRAVVYVLVLVSAATTAARLALEPIPGLVGLGREAGVVRGALGLSLVRSFRSR